MTGSTFICCTEPEKLQVLESEGIDAIDEFVHVDMGVMLTLDFEALCGPAAVKWSVKDPVIFDEDDGLAVFQIRGEALQLVINHPREELEPEHQADLEALKAFILKHGDAAVYEVATF